MSWYAYCLTEQQATNGTRSRRPFILDGIQGVNSSTVLSYPSGDFAVIVSEFDRATTIFEERQVLEHARVVSVCFRQGTVLPFKFGTVFDSDECLKQAVRANRRAFGESVARLKGKAEMHVKLLVRDGTLKELRDVQIPDTVGGEYLAKLKEKDKALNAARDSVDKGDKDALALRDKLALLEKENTERTKELTTASRIIDNLRDEKKKLGTDVDKLRAAAENRFEGIALTGRRVVFLVDMSGSMELVDENTEAPHKWQGVRDTVARILKSLPDLEKFQVIVFSDRSRFLLGNSEWVDFEGKPSVDRVTRALADIKPKGGTNMYAALDAAFRFRAGGLDTIYLLSDGLPNLGPGLKTSARKLTEVQRGTILGKHVRDTLRTKWNSARSSQPRVRINTIGFFYESPDLGAFLWALARENDGSFVGMSKP